MDSTCVNASDELCSSVLQFVMNTHQPPDLFTWCVTITASCTVGLTSLSPLILLRFAKDEKLFEKNSRILKYLLSFAVGSLLGDVFLHILPEAWRSVNYHRELTNIQLYKTTDMKAIPVNQQAYFSLGLLVLLGLVTFHIIEIIFAITADDKRRDELDRTDAKLRCRKSCDNQSVIVKNQLINDDNSLSLSARHPSLSKQTMLLNNNIKKPSKISAYLNLFANAIDNFSHGLAVGASFSAGIKIGLLTTFAIIIHEIPHEIGDFAILIRNGFEKW